MRRLLALVALVVLVLLVLLVCLGCEGPVALQTVKPKPARRELPTVNVPAPDRQKNWLGNQREGSCVWASTVSLLRWQGRYHTAAWIRQNYGNGEYPEHWMQLADKIGIRYAMTTSGDVKFLEWACKTRRGAGVTVMGGAHMVCLVYLDDKWAALLDNNRVDKFIWVPRNTFVAEWKASYGWALTPVYTPAAPLPQ